MYSNAKAIRLIQDLNDLLTVRLASNAGLNTVSQAFYTDANGAAWPYLLISHNGNVAADQPVIFIEISNVDAVSKDIFGNQTYAYAPHVLQFGWDPSASSAVALADLLVCEFESIKSGVRFQAKNVTAHAQVNAANVNAAAAVADIDELYWPTKLV
jgi:hypothetical protein